MTKLTMNTTGTTKNRALATTEAACATPKSNAFGRPSLTIWTLTPIGIYRRRCARE